MSFFLPITTQTAAKVDNVAAAEVASVGEELADLSLWGMFMQADLVVKAVMIGLLLASFWCWAIIFEKMARFGDLRRRAAKFEQDFWSAETLESYYDHIKRQTRHPFAVVFMAAIEEWFRTGKDVRDRTVRALAPSGLDRIAKVMGVARNRELERLEKGMGFLGSVGSAAPFIGLFGTVWGIMNSFQSIAYSNNTSLAVVAPGIAEALLATAIGLFAAIPAVIAYNRFSSDLGQYAGDLEDFETEFLALLSRQTDRARGQ
jgi:biopolymer transport protein TolQ